MDNVERFTASLNSDQYYFKTPGGQDAHYAGVSPLTQTTVNGPRELYRFLYIAAGTPASLDCNSDLEVVYVNGITQLEPFSTLNYSFAEKKFAILLAYTTEPDPYTSSPSIQVSEVNSFGTVNETNYDQFESVFKDRLIGAINIRFTRDQSGLLSVDSCLVNKGQVPDWS